MRIHRICERPEVAFVAAKGGCTRGWYSHEIEDIISVLAFQKQQPERFHHNAWDT